jgi:phosphoribosylformylglycinamidine synthase subunit PurS
MRNVKCYLLSQANASRRKEIIKSNTNLPPLVKLSSSLNLHCRRSVREAWHSTPHPTPTFNTQHSTSNLELFPFLSTFAVQIHQMIYSVQVTVMPLKDLLDPQGKAVMGGLKSLGIQSIQDVRIGKNINLQVEANSPEQAKQVAEDASRKLLANPVMEIFEISVH